MLLTTQIAYRKCLGTCDSLLCSSDTQQSALETGQEVRIVQINFSASFGRVNHRGIFHMPCSVCIGGSVLALLAEFPSNRSQHVMVDSCRSKLVNVASGVSQGSVLVPYCPPDHLGFSILENKLIGYADDSTLIALCHPQASELQ